MDAIAPSVFWLHVDLDVLSTADFGAVDYPQPGGLHWDELDRLVAPALESRRCHGASIAIYNPDLDPGRTAAAQVVEFVVRVVERTRRSTSGG